jgi:hypothetical protein
MVGLICIRPKGLVITLSISHTRPQRHTTLSNHKKITSHLYHSKNFFYVANQRSSINQLMLKFHTIYEFHLYPGARSLIKVVFVASSNVGTFFGCTVPSKMIRFIILTLEIDSLNCRKEIRGVSFEIYQASQT